MLVQKKNAELKIIEGIHNHNLGHEIHNISPSWNNNLISLDPAKHVMVLISLKVVMKQLALDVNLILIVIYHLNAPENATPTDILATILLTNVTP